ncbi:MULTISPECIES: sensor histidine kinase [Microbacterium]|uniref:sensor histidine kinase n=1 Tax=Microbacterium TaxID=33882 RepID=UPI002782DE1A|nr:MULTISPECIES: ATP-binding protein [Microbacterium]MDQ1083949.1 two-component system NarL family sensor kinase [Microbacterium sp. SORGH_AS_0344]MDQ1170772.1 two-component system NarL family sensor kinase [Microbacterium proteolyticum]
MRGSTPSATTIVRRHLLAAAAVTLAIVAALVGVEWSLATAEADRVTRAAATRVAERVSSVLSAADFARGTIDVAALDGRLEGFFAAGSVVRVKVWRVEDDAARVVYSDERRLIGDRRPYSPVLAERLARQGVVVLEVPDDAEHRFEAGGDELREAFIAFTDAGGAALRLEVYVPVFRDAWVRSTLAVYVPVLVGGVATLVAVLVPMSVRLARRLSDAEIDRRLAIEYGLRSRERERLRLGRRLHDDVLQDLAGSALALEALASAPDPARLRAIASMLANDARTLRGILDAAAPERPPALAEAIEAAVTPARSSGLTVELDIRTDAEPDAETSRLLVEAARELVRNVREHAHASRATVNLRTEPGVIVLTVSDDGQGFAPGRTMTSGHGLRLLQSAFAEVQGDLTVTTSDGGTVARGRVPVESEARVAPAPATML